MARRQAPGLRMRFVLAPVERRSPLVVRRRVRALAPGADMTEDSCLAGVRSRLEEAVAEYASLAPEFASGAIEPAEGAALYFLVRALRPATVVETGTANGVSTTYLLAALEHNGAGRLVSIDLPFEAADGSFRPLVAGTSIGTYEASPLPPGKPPGWMVPQALRGRWELRLGHARELLPALLDEVGEIGFFFHDSLHTREHMLFEFNAVWPNLSPRGVLAADDIFQWKHDALPTFARSVGRRFTTFGNLGFVRK
jgi:predicted O-methyltransferase YrrM